MNRHVKKTRSAYSLLEVLLALGLTVVIFAAIAAGIRLHLVSIARQQLKIEQRQIARSLLNTIGRDIRSAVFYRATDYSGLENIHATQQKQLQEAGGLLGVNDDPGEDLILSAIESASTNSTPSSSASSSGSTTGEEIEVDLIVQEDAVSFRPVLQGTNRSIQFDVSRLPRLDQYRTFGAEGSEGIQSTPSDIKSIGYFFSSSAAPNEPIDQSNTSLAPGGLYRREIDRAVASFAGIDGLRTSPDGVSRLLAPEVAALSFRYFDGTDWWTQWDFDERNSLPTAVEIQLSLDPTRTEPTLANDPAKSEPSFYRSVVHLPLAQPNEGEDE